MQHFPFLLLYDSPSATQAGQKTARCARRAMPPSPSDMPTVEELDDSYPVAWCDLMPTAHGLPINPVLRGRELWAIRAKMV